MVYEIKKKKSIKNTPPPLVGIELGDLDERNTLGCFISFPFSASVS
jgi:hypothetical protein